MEENQKHQQNNGQMGHSNLKISHRKGMLQFSLDYTEFQRDEVELQKKQLIPKKDTFTPLYTNTNTHTNRWR